MSPFHFLKSYTGLLGAMVVLGSTACHEDLNRFDTADGGAFCGSIVEGQFVRSGYGAQLRMRLTLDISELDSRPGALTVTGDETGQCPSGLLFDDAALHNTPAVFADSFSELQFGRARDHNFVAWVDSSCSQSALAVLSLMHDGSVEVRLLSRGPAQGETGNFALFQLARTDCEE